MLWRQQESLTRKGTECRTDHWENFWTKSVTHCKWMGETRRSEREAQKRRSAHHRWRRKGREQIDIGVERPSELSPVSGRSIAMVWEGRDGNGERADWKRAARRALWWDCDITWDPRWKGWKSKDLCPCFTHANKSSIVRAIKALSPRAVWEKWLEPKWQRKAMMCHFLRCVSQSWKSPIHHKQLCFVLLARTTDWTRCCENDVDVHHWVRCVFFARHEEQHWHIVNWRSDVFIQTTCWPVRTRLSGISSICGKKSRSTRWEESRTQDIEDSSVSKLNEYWCALLRLCGIVEDMSLTYAGFRRITSNRKRLSRRLGRGKILRAIGDNSREAFRQSSLGLKRHLSSETTEHTTCRM